MDGGAGGDIQPVEGEVLDGLPGDPGCGGADPHDLLDRGRSQFRALPEQPPLGRVINEDLHGQAELIAGGVEAAEDQQSERIPQLSGRQALPGGLFLHQGGHKIVPGTAPAISDQRVGIVIQRRQRGLDPGQMLTDLHAHRQAYGRRLRSYRRPFFLRDAQQDRDDAGGVRVGELGHELTPAPFGEGAGKFGR